MSSVLFISHLEQLFDSLGRYLIPLILGQFIGYRPSFVRLGKPNIVFGEIRFQWTHRTRRVALVGRSLQFCDFAFY